MLSKEVKKEEEVEEDNKILSFFVRKKEEIDDKKPIKSALSGSLPNPGKKEEFVEDDDKKPVNSSAGVSKGMLNMDSAFVFMSYMKEAFYDEPAIHKECINVFMDFKARRLDGAGTLARLAELMKDHGDLLRAYSVLFPKANITVPPEAYQALGPNQTITGTSVSRKNKEASLYMASVKEAFDDEPAKYKEFLKVLKDVRAQSM
ncbi:hypothetical protein AALP_AA1G218500 [Arabis alpina]|uniref:Uncharacterized protein n=1 Tax=Arabis alpina TaxID=50452 RepID=A0A087HPS2_ARAAL|nr:hypothetical protein AALP_AA1G218500 [Arabis alpina]